MSAAHHPPTPPPVALELAHIEVFRAWLAHGPGTARHLSGKSDLPLIEVRPRSEDLHAIGALTIVGQTSDGPSYAVATAAHDINAPSATDIAQRHVHTLPVRDQVSIAASIMARYGRRRLSRSASTRAQLDLPAA